jgi:CheY-like chemotaxis protein
MARILLVDDDKDIRNFGIALLTEAGHESFAADGVTAAIEFLQTHSMDMVITDANMPHHSGFDLMHTLKRDRRWRDLTLVMLTGRRERKDIERAIALGAHDYIVKPLDPMLFLQKIASLLDRRPPADRPEVDFAAVHLAIRARAVAEIELGVLSELGFSFRSPHHFRDGSKIEVNSDIFERIGALMPILRVQSCVQKNESTWETRVVYIGADERFLTKIRAWIYSHSSQGVRAA